MICTVQGEDSPSLGLQRAFATGISGGHGRAKCRQRPSGRKGQFAAKTLPFPIVGMAYKAAAAADRFRRPFVGARGEQAP